MSDDEYSKIASGHFILGQKASWTEARQWLLKQAGEAFELWLDDRAQHLRKLAALAGEKADAKGREFDEFEKANAPEKYVDRIPR